MTHMTTFTLPPALGDTATVILTGVITHTSARGDGSGVAVVDPDGHHPVCLPLGEGMHAIPGDIMPTLMQALDYALEYGGEQDPEWVDPATLDWLDQIERLRDYFRGSVGED